VRLSLGAQHELSVGLPKRFYAQSSVRGGSGLFRTGRAGLRRRRRRHSSPHTRWCLMAVAAGANHFRHSVHRCCAMPRSVPQTSQPPHWHRRWVTIPPLSALASSAAPDHDRAAGWVTTRAPLKRFPPPVSAVDEQRAGDATHDGSSARVSAPVAGRCRQEPALKGATEDGTNGRTEET